VPSPHGLDNGPALHLFPFIACLAH
jgi:hypothetical protein